MSLLAGKTAVITGGSSGIGLATARRFIDEGATVVVMGRRAPELEAALTILGPNATAVRGDVTVAADLQRLHDVVAATGKGLDIVFVNARTIEMAVSAANDSMSSPARYVARLLWFVSVSPQLNALDAQDIAG
jgi:NAD(P)-dependent dehydrogenase (short-subunit alcohol dehydrogenase family)